MGDAYTPGLTVTRSTLVRKTRRLPLPGKVLVEVGARVGAREVVARTELPGKVTIINLASALGAMPDEVAAKLVVQPGGAVTQDAAVAKTQSLFGLIKTAVPSPITGVLESVSPVTGMAVFREPPVPVEITAYVDGTIVEVIPSEGVVVEARGALVQGIFGLGGERLAEIVVASKDRERPLDAKDLAPEHRGKIVIGGARATLAAMRRAFELEIAAIVTGGFAYQDVRELLGYDVGVAITGNEPIATTLVVTEGFGEIAMARATFELLTSLAGKLASVNGATQIRAGVIRPEVIVPDPDTTIAATAGAGGLEIGAPVRCIRAPYFGRIGTVVALPPQPAVLPTETHVRVLEVDLGGERVVVPRANVEVIER